MRSNHIAQGFMQPGPEIPQGLRLHNLLATEPLPDCPNVGFPLLSLFQFVAIVSLLRISLLVSSQKCRMSTLRYPKPPLL